MVRGLFLIITMFCLSVGKAQLFLPVGAGFDQAVVGMVTDTVSNKIYFLTNHGYLANGNSSRYVSAFDGTNWTYFGAQLQYPLFAITEYKGKIYSGGIDSLYEFNGSQWTQKLTIGANTGLTRLYADDSLLYAAGDFNSFEGITCNSIACWNGTTWSDCGLPLTTCQNNIFAIKKFQGKLFIGGGVWDPQNCGQGQVGYLYHDGMSWKTDSLGIFGNVFKCVYDFEEYNGDLYMAGSWRKSDGNVCSSIMKWVNGKFYDVGGGTEDGSNWSYVKDLFTYNNSLYAIGSFLKMGGVPTYQLAKWDGNEWCSIGLDTTGCGGWNLQPLTMGSVNGELYIGGQMPIVNGDTVWHLVKWNGGNYTDSCGVIQPVGIDEVASNPIKFFPNPSKDILTIDFNFQNDTEIQILDLAGNVVIKNIVTREQNQINVSKLAIGMYFIQISFGGKIYSEKFLKE